MAIEPNPEMENDALARYLRRPTRRRLTAVVRLLHICVWNTARRICGNQEDAEDVSQDVFLSLLLRPPPPDSVRSARGYFAYRVLTIAMRSERSRERRRRREVEAARTAAQEAGGATGGLAPDWGDALREAIRTLPERMRAAIDLRYLAGLRNREIADVLGVSERTVEDDLHGGREALRCRLGAGALGLAILGQGAVDSAPPWGFLEDLLRVVRDGSALGALDSRAGMQAVGTAVAKKTLAAAALLVVVTALALWVAVRPHGPPRDARTQRTPALSEARDPTVATPLKKDEANEVPRAPTEEGLPDVPQERRPLVAVTGWTVDRAGSAVSGATVKAYTSPSSLQSEGNLEYVRLLGEAISDESGAFRLSFEAPAKHFLTLTGEVDGGGMGWNRPDAYFTSSGPVPPLISGIVIEIPSKTASLEGKVLDKEGRPVEGATVWAVVKCGAMETHFAMDTAATGRGMATTSRDGRFVLAGLPEGSPIDLFAEHPLYLSTRLQNVLAGVRPLEIRLEPGVSFSGRGRWRR